MLLQRTIFIIIKPDASGESLHEKFMKKISNNNNNKCVFKCYTPPLLHGLSLLSKHSLCCYRAAESV